MISSVRKFLQPAQHVESAAPARPLERIRRIGDRMKFAQNEARHDERAFEKSAFDDLHDASVDDHRGVDDLWMLAPLRPARRGARLEQIAIFAPTRAPEIGGEVATMR